ncbi:MAG: DksA/TraR family C4-type zinc finger protein [Acidobacteriota bacterium]|nr:DksA/TraR family C4-type zinc finger protein [Acidobacteriota bacterium]HVB37792.1 DksA/TraR family C4-type zinc finger protein [Vicinamibacterales bacterium]
MAGGWFKEGSIHENIDAHIEKAVRKARSEMGTGESLTHCAECGEPIPEARRVALPGVRKCVKCQEAADAENATSTGKRMPKGR